MSTDHVTHATTAATPVAVPLVRSPVELHSGDRMSREEFHRLYEQTPEDFKAELIGGIVYVASPLRLSHSDSHLLLGAVLTAYVSRTAGTHAGDNATVFLGEDGEPQPDLFLRVLPEYGGQSTTSPDDHVMGAPDLVVEVAHSSQAIDLHDKKNMYAKYGCKEYLVACLREQQLRWFDLATDKELPPDPSGILRPAVFPGLWLNGPALFAHDYAQLMATLEQGMATPEHRAFVQQVTAVIIGSRYYRDPVAWAILERPRVAAQIGATQRLSEPEIYSKNTPQPIDAIALAELKKLAANAVGQPRARLESLAAHDEFPIAVRYFAKHEPRSKRFKSTADERVFELANADVKAMLLS